MREMLYGRKRNGRKIREVERVEGREKVPGRKWAVPAIPHPSINMPTSIVGLSGNTHMEVDE